MAAGLSRIIEVSIILRDANTISEDGDANSWQYIPPFVSFFLRSTYFLLTKI
jgi:hypothetical protein